MTSELRGVELCHFTGFMIPPSFLPSTEGLTHFSDAHSDYRAGLDARALLPSSAFEVYTCAEIGLIFGVKVSLLHPMLLCL